MLDSLLVLHVHFELAAAAAYWLLLTILVLPS